METEYSSNVVRVLHPTAPPNASSNWDEQHYESKTTTRKILDPTPVDHQLTSTNFVRQAQTNYSTRSNYSTKSNREYNIDDGLLEQPYISNPASKITTTTTKNYTTKTSGGGSNGNVEYLDELLDDLKQERTHNPDINEYTQASYKYNSSSNIPETSTYNKRTVQQHYDTYNASKSISSSNLIENHPGTGTTIKRTEHVEVLPQGSIQRSKHVEVLNSKTLETVPLLPVHQTNASSETKTTTIKRDVVLPPELKEIPIETPEELLPLPGTKVTTTVRTYTYEVPSVVTRQNVLIHDDRCPEPIINTTINKNYSEKITNIHDNYSTTTDRRIVNGNLPPDTDIPVETIPHIQEPDSGPGPKRTYYYKHEIHNTKNTINHPPPPQPIINEYHITKNTTNTTMPVGWKPGVDEPHHLRPISPESISPAPPPSVTHHTYITKTTTTTNDYPDGPRPRDYGPYDGPKGSPYDGGPQPHPPTGGPITTYMRTHEKTTNTTMPFPVDGTGYPPQNSGVQPPKDVDDLMATFDRNGDVTDTDELRRKREIDTSVATSDKVRVPSRNQAGPPVYYPPNSELSLRKKEEGGGAWRAQGGYAAGASGYEYHAESSSKSKTKSGAAVVPVCLPLCCAMPCVLM